MAMQDEQISYAQRCVDVCTYVFMRTSSIQQLGCMNDIIDIRLDVVEFDVRIQLQRLS